MLRVLMLLEDYGELIFFQTVLKKIGFDVDAHQNAHSLPEMVMNFRPEVLVMSAFGKRVPGNDLSQTVRKTRDQPHILLLHTAGQEPTINLSVDRWLLSPIGATKLVDAIADVAELDRDILRDKFNRIKLHEVEAETYKRIEGTADRPESVSVASRGPNLAESTLDPAQRQARFASALSAAPVPTSHGFSLAQVKAQVEALRSVEDPKATADLERERREFVSQLFRKK